VVGPAWHLAMAWWFCHRCQQIARLTDCSLFLLAEERVAVSFVAGHPVGQL